MLRVFGRLPDTGVGERTEAGVRKASGEETAGELSPAVVSAYGDFGASIRSDRGIANKTPGCAGNAVFAIGRRGRDRDEDVAPSDLRFGGRSGR
jgi:hypothetical protein